MSFETSALLATWVAIVLLASVVAALVRQVHALSSGRVHPRADEVGLRKGKPAPGHARLARGHEGVLLLLFLSDGCAICAEVLAEAESVAAGSPGLDLGIRVLFPTPGDRPAGTLVVLGGEMRLFDEYQVPATPFAVTVDTTGRVVRSDPVGSRRTARQLMEQVVSSATANQPTLLDNQTTGA